MLPGWYNPGVLPGWYNPGVLPGLRYPGVTGLRYPGVTVLRYPGVTRRCIGDASARGLPVGVLGTLLHVGDQDV